jgi:hypothetical protein
LSSQKVLMKNLKLYKWITINHKYLINHSLHCFGKSKTNLLNFFSFQFMTFYVDSMKNSFMSMSWRLIYSDNEASMKNHMKNIYTWIASYMFRDSIHYLYSNNLLLKCFRALFIHFSQVLQNRQYYIKNNYVALLSNVCTL